jgi:hypothetical protein
VQQENPLLDAVTLGGTLQGIDQGFEGLIEPEYGVAAPIVRIVEEPVVQPVLALYSLSLDALSAHEPSPGLDTCHICPRPSRSK